MGDEISGTGRATRPEAARRPGRPRDARRDRAILAATLEVVAEVGFEAMSIERVAARAGVGKTTIYRRWASKEDLAIDAVRGVHAEIPIVDTGDLRADLLALARSAEQGTPRATLERLLPRFLAEAATNPALFDAYQEAILTPRLRQFTTRIERAQARGEIRPDLDASVVVDLVTGAVLSRFLLTARVAPPPPDFVERMIDTLWRGLALSLRCPEC